MKKLKLSPMLAVGMAAAVQINQDQALAGTVTFTNQTTLNGLTITLPISPDIANADELLSVSGGAITGNESGSFTLTVDYSNSTTQQIYSYTGFSFSNKNFQFTAIPAETFAQGDIVGLTFKVTGGGSVQTIPAGTVFTFDVVPEPTTLALAALGAGGMWLAARRRK